MKGFSHYLFWLSSLALFGVCGLDPGTLGPMRIATWNVNSLSARLEAVERWLERAAPDVLLMQETKLSDDAVPEMPFRMAGYQLVHHGEGRWNGVAIASRLPVEDAVVTNFGDGPVRDSRRATSPERRRSRNWSRAVSKAGIRSGDTGSPGGSCRWTTIGFRDTPFRARR